MLCYHEIFSFLERKERIDKKNIIEFIFSLLIIFDFDNYHEDVQLPMV